MRATNWVGDAVMSLPALQMLRRRFPAAHIAVLARPWVGGVYAREPFADEVISFEAGKGWRDLRGKRRLAKELREMNFDCALLLQNAFEAAAIVRAAGIRERIGYDRDGRGFLLTKAIKLPEKGEIPPHEQFYYLELLRRVGWIDALPDEGTIRLTGAAQAREAGLEHFRSLGITGPIVGVSPGAAFGTAKRWLPERFAEAAASLALQMQATVALFGSPNERALCDSIAVRITTPVRNFAGDTTLREFIDMAAACSFYLTNDSGGMHIASALGVPTLAVFGATNHITTGPTGDNSRVVREPVDCSPCLLRECPIDHRCMTRVSSERVVDEARDLLNIASMLK